MARIAAEDTRRTRGLLTHLGVSKPLERLDAHASANDIARVVELFCLSVVVSSRAG